MNSNVTGEKKRENESEAGIQKPNLTLKTALHRFYQKPEKLVRFQYKIQFLEFRKRKLKTVVFLKTEWFFGLSVGFLFKIQILNENDKSAGFFWFIAQFFWFLVSQKFEL
jgi:hypothetical protein